MLGLRLLNHVANDKQINLPRQVLRVALDLEVAFLAELENRRVVQDHTDEAGTCMDVVAVEGVREDEDVAACPLGGTLGRGIDEVEDVA